MNVLPGVRAHVADALASVGVTIHKDYTVDAPTPPCVILLPGSPYLAAHAFTASEVSLDVAIIGQRTQGAATFDALIESVVDALHAARTITVGPVDGPRIDSDPGTLVAIIPTTTVWED